MSTYKQQQRFFGVLSANFPYPSSPHALYSAVQAAIRGFTGALLHVMDIIYSYRLKMHLRTRSYNYLEIFHTSMLPVCLCASRSHWYWHRMHGWDTNIGNAQFIARKNCRWWSGNKDASQIYGMGRHARNSSKSRKVLHLEDFCCRCRSRFIQVMMFGIVRYCVTQ